MVCRTWSLARALTATSVALTLRVMKLDCKALSGEARGGASTIVPFPSDCEALSGETRGGAPTIVPGPRDVKLDCEALSGEARGGAPTIVPGPRDDDRHMMFVPDCCGLALTDSDTSVNVDDRQWILENASCAGVPCAALALA